MKEHYTADDCGNGLDALDYINMADYDGIILDIMLPGLNGCLLYTSKAVHAKKEAKEILKEHGKPKYERP